LIGEVAVVLVFVLEVRKGTRDGSGITKLSLATLLMDIWGGVVRVDNRYRYFLNPPFSYNSGVCPSMFLETFLINFL
jgi:hypothetical protein